MAERFFINKMIYSRWPLKPSYYEVRKSKYYSDYPKEDWDKACNEAASDLIEMFNEHWDLFEHVADILYSFKELTPKEINEIIDLY